MLESVKTIQPPVWMTDYKTVHVMRVLGAYETVPQSLFVGGCVRNALLEKPVTDIDIATIHSPLHVIDKLKAAGIRFVPTGLDHGTITAIVENASFEITTLRKDIETDGRHAVIAFTTKWEEDAQRRDFTINTLLAAPDGRIFDPTGEGLPDLERRRVVFVGDARERVREDYLRILRFFRFHAQYGAGAPDKVAIQACAAFADKIETLSKERISQEFLKILLLPTAPAVLNEMREAGVLSSILEKYDFDVMQTLCEFQTRYDSIHIPSRLHALFSDGNYLVLSNNQKDGIKQLKSALSHLPRISKKRVREIVYRFGNEIAVQTYFLKLSKERGPLDMELLDIARYWQAPRFPVTATQVMESGVPQGPKLGETLAALEEKWIAKDFPPNFSYKK